MRDTEIPPRADLTPAALRPPALVAPGSVQASVTDGQEYSSPDNNSAAPLPVPYLVVTETPAFHGTLPTAQWIPDVSYAGVTGTLSANDTIDLYRVDNVQGTLALRLAVAYDQAPLRLLVFNERGKVIAVDTTS
ncbi:MAG: hypothetical protein JO161_08375, partial [Planctomycetaceae bacterium]|nr:hypothetical protein [Planctomycetaceae bacterium]